MKEQFVNRYSLPKTLRSSLIPVGKTEDSFNKNLLLKRINKEQKITKRSKAILIAFTKNILNPC